MPCSLWIVHWRSENSAGPKFNRWSWSSHQNESWCYNTSGTVTHPAHNSLINSSCHPFPSLSTFLQCFYLQSLLEAGEEIIYFFTRLRKTSLAILKKEIRIQKKKEYFSPLFWIFIFLALPGSVVIGQLQDIIYPIYIHIILTIGAQWNLKHERPQSTHFWKHFSSTTERFLPYQVEFWMAHLDKKEQPWLSEDFLV